MSNYLKKMSRDIALMCDFLKKSQINPLFVRIYPKKMFINSIFVARYSSTAFIYAAVKPNRNYYRQAVARRSSFTHLKSGGHSH